MALCADAPVEYVGAGARPRHGRGACGGVLERTQEGSRYGRQSHRERKLGFSFAPATRTFLAGRSRGWSNRSASHHHGSGGERQTRSGSSRAIAMTIVSPDPVFPSVRQVFNTKHDSQEITKHWLASGSATLTSG